MFLWFIVCFWQVPNPFNIWRIAWISGVKQRSWPLSWEKKPRKHPTKTICLGFGELWTIFGTVVVFRRETQRGCWNDGVEYFTILPTILAWRKVCDTCTWKIPSPVSFVLFTVWRIVNKFLHVFLFIFADLIMQQIHHPTLPLVENGCAEIQ